MKSLSLGSFGEVRIPFDSPSIWSAPSGAEMANLDRLTIAAGTPALELMERAGAAVVELIKEIVAARGIVDPHIVIVCGPGNNGGDGRVIARLLAELGMHVSIISATAVSDTWRADLRAAHIVVDALLGTGQRQAPRGRIAELIENIVAERERRAELIVISVDIPTGIDCDTGAVFTPHICADYTLTVELIKRGMLQFPARQACGVIVVAPIGIEARSEIEFSIIEGAKVPRGRQRLADAHKGMQGRVLVIGGCAAMPGASALAALGALRSGSGLVSRSTKPLWTGVEVAPECMNVVLDEGSSHYTDNDCDRLKPQILAADAIVIGPGLGREDATYRFLAKCVEVLRDSGKRCVIDADALTLISTGGIDLRGVNGVITPHPGEAALLLQTSVEQVQADRFSAVKALHARYGISALLKGAGTLVWDGARGGIIARGSPYMATAGSGDVLSGIIATCMNRCENLFDAVVMGAYIHALGGERAVKLTGGPIIASDIALSAASVVGELSL